MAALLGPVSGRAEPSPDRPIEITVPARAGSATDRAARLLAGGLSRRLGERVVIHNEPGAGGGLAYERVAAQRPDGRALVWASPSLSTAFHAGASAVGHRAFDAVARVLIETPLLAVHADSPWRDLPAMLADARRNPGKILVGTTGTGSPTHLASAGIFRAAGVDVVDVSVESVQVVPGLLGHTVDAAVHLPPVLAPQVRAGNLRLLAVASGRRDPAFPQVPTAAEQGVDVAFETWRGLLAPRGTPGAVLARLEDAVRATVAGPGFAAGLRDLGATPAFQTAAAFAERIEADDARYARLMDAVGLLKR